MLSLAAKQERRCRVSQRRTLDTVRRALNSWCLIFGKEPVKFDPASTSCSGLAAEVKQLISHCPSESIEETMAFQSIKKLLPPSCKCQEDGFLDGLMESMVRSPRNLPHGYLKFVMREVSRLFPVGWDRTYRDHCFTTSPPLSSTLDYTRREGGCLNTSYRQAEYLSDVLGTSAPLSPPSNRTQPMVVQSAGKPRPLSKFSDDTLLLKPLHKAIYDHLSTKKWLCRGDVTAEALDKAGFAAGLGDLVSGDYKSATDNLPLEVAELVLKIILRKSNVVPQGIQDYAQRILRPWFMRSGERVDVTSGQQMGSLLSFPLLCIQNYIAFRWACKNRKVECPVLINGDDILFQSSLPGFPDEWMKVVGEVGLEVECTKTSVASDYGTLNSTLLRWKKDRLRVVPTLRFGMLRSMPFPNSLSKGFSSFCTPGLPAQVRFNAGLEFLKWHSSIIRKTGLSPQELGFTGRMAWRCFFKVGLLRSQKVKLRDDPLASMKKVLPRPPCPHNLALSSDMVDWVPSLLPEEELLNRREMASWKWRVKDTFSESSKSLKVRFWLGLSRPAVAVPSLLAIAESRREVPDWYQRVKKEYFEPRAQEPVRQFLFKGIDRLPQYDEVNTLLGGEMLEANMSYPSKDDATFCKARFFEDLYSLGVPARKSTAT